MEGDGSRLPSDPKQKASKNSDSGGNAVASSGPSEAPNSQSTVAGNQAIGSGDVSVRPKTHQVPMVPESHEVDKLSTEFSRRMKLDLKDEGGSDSSIGVGHCRTRPVKEMVGESSSDVRDYSRADIEHTFTALYCYSNLLDSISENNEADHHRFINFIRQVEHKQSELIRVSKALPECTNLAIDLAYNFVVTASYMNLMFTWETGKESLGEELTELMLINARQMLEFAHMSRADLVPDCVEEMITVMQKFCLVTVIEQAGKLPNLTANQSHLLSKILDHLAKAEVDSNASISSLDLSESLEDSEFDEDVKTAKNFGKSAYQSALKEKQPGSMNTNNNADNPELSDSSDDSDVPDQDSAGAAASKPGKVRWADVDDIILFTNCNPYASIWKLYTDNSELVALFKINNSLRTACEEVCPDCFQILLCLEEVGHCITSNCITQEVDMVSSSFKLLQRLVSSSSMSANERVSLHKIVQRYTDIDERIAELFSWCENQIFNSIDQIRSSSAASSAASSSRGSSPDIEVKTPAK